MLSLPKNLPNLPRYTSYPTAPHFNKQMASLARETLLNSIVNSNQPVSTYIHIPFCDRLCWFCGCHTKHTLRYEPVVKYVGALLDELRQFHRELQRRPKLSALHFGGGSPSLLKPQEASKIRAGLEQAFEFQDDAEISVEVDPNDTSVEMLHALEELGMTRASLGVQDFDERVQKAINRPQGFEETADLVSSLRQSGITSLNIDALYGLPFQTNDSIAQTIRKVLSLDPDRIALFGYAHVPSIKKHQNMIDATALPDDRERLEQARIAKELILGFGYEAIGIDHFAKKEDRLAISKRNGTLRRNFQGYTVDEAEVLLGFGASSISSSTDVYLQNTVSTQSYMRKVVEKESVVEKGFVLSQDDKIRAHIIQALMCNFSLDLGELLLRYGDTAQSYVDEVRAVATENPYGLCSFDGNVLQVLPDRQEYVRVIAARFDAYLDSGASRYSKAV